ncbi:NAD-dependent epimerase/dehydratase family protein [Dokdonella koreensis]|uniref:3-beta hydroxysteroid dehydrogenase/isomerase n=1 Tax=Dokdonella koreensis DS-123 TaxID=1300342 RepID=A0A160DY82_9GAMM|nr:NAD-dependent epimerase/dehydratase family protein [Dokdonella koreensis]ANB19738.1 3-beta hydroxysteroid dehydrogenase/isomerase [Dokdonella koreensis DS-123]
MQILLTGAGGLLGRAIARQLVDRGHLVRALVRTPQPPLDALGVEQWEGTTESLDTVIAIANGCDAIVHVAGNADPLAAIEACYEANVAATDVVLAAAELAGVRRLVFTSCASVVVGVHDINGGGETLPYPPRWPAAYPHAKALAEQRVLAANGEALATVALRPGLLWAPEEARVTPRLIDLARRGRLRLTASPANRIDCCHVENAALAHALAVERLEPDAAIAGRSYFVSDGEPISIEALLAALLRAHGLALPTRRLSPQLAHWLAASAGLRRRLPGGRQPLLEPFLLNLVNRNAWFNIAAARRDLGYAPQASTRDALARLARR